MRMPVSSQIERICGERGGIHQPWLDVTDGCVPMMVATDGAVIAAVPVSLDEGDVEGHVPREAVAHGRTEALARGATWFGIRLGQEFVHSGLYERLFARSLSKIRPPDWRRCLPGPDEVFHARVTLDARLLLDLALALGSSGPITIEIPENPFNPIRAKAVGRWIVPGGIGLLMPIRPPQGEAN